MADPTVVLQQRRIRGSVRARYGSADGVPKLCWYPWFSSSMTHTCRTVGSPGRPPGAAEPDPATAVVVAVPEPG